MVKRIHLSWRKGKGERRFLVGELKRSPGNIISFKYNSEVITQAQKEGFKDYPGFSDVHKEYTEDVMSVFSLRLIPAERADRKQHLDFWEASSEMDHFDLLALTQGLLPTDNFEFIGLYNFEKNFSFITDIASLSHQKIDKNAIAMGDSLRYHLEPSNDHDKNAVQIYKGDLLIGYIKKGHTRFFNEAGSQPIKISVKAIDGNGTIRQLFVKVSS